MEKSHETGKSYGKSHGNRENPIKIPSKSPRHPMVMDPKEAVTKRGCSGAAGGSAARKVKTLVWAPSPTELTLLTWGKRRFAEGV